jgi:hypothetical protein
VTWRSTPTNRRIAPRRGAQARPADNNSNRGGPMSRSLRFLCVHRLPLSAANSFKCVAAIILSAALVVSAPVAAWQTRYKLIDTGTLGGPTSSLGFEGARNLNNRGTLISSADTALQGPCFICIDGYVAHGVEWRNSVLTDLRALPTSHDVLAPTVNPPRRSTRVAVGTGREISAALQSLPASSALASACVQPGPLHPAQLPYTQSPPLDPSLG